MDNTVAGGIPNEEIQKLGRKNVMNQASLANELRALTGRDVNAIQDRKMIRENPDEYVKNHKQDPDFAQRVYVIHDIMQSLPRGGEEGVFMKLADKIEDVLASGVLPYVMNAMMPKELARIMHDVFESSGWNPHGYVSAA